MKRVFFSALLLSAAASLHAQVVLKNLSLTDPGQNVLYIGVENQLIIEGLSDREDLDVMVGEKVFQEFRDHFPVTVHNQGVVDVCVYKKVKGGRQLLFSNQYRAAILGYPEVRVPGAKDSILPISYIMNNPQLEVFVPNSQFKLIFSISSFLLEMVDGNGVPILDKVSVQGNTLSGAILAQIKKLKPGDRLLFSAIRGNTPDGRTQMLRPYTVYVK